MKPKAKIIPFPQPPKDASIVRVLDGETLRQEDLKASYERGKQEGERALGEQLVKQRAELQELQNGVLAALRQTLPQVARECERTLVALALEVAQKLVAGLPIAVDTVEAAVREACAQVEAGTEHTVQLHPDDLALLQSAHSPLLLPSGGADRVRFESAPQVTRGGCLVQTRFGVIDARRETKLHNLQNSLQP